MFSIGDEVVAGVRNGKIGKFISAERLQLSCVDCEPCYNLSELQKAKQPILTTTDGVDVYENTSIWILFEQTWRLSNIPSCKNMHQELTSDRSANTYKYFSTKEAAEEYILLNKPMLSIKDVENLFRVQDRKSIVMNHGCDVIKKEDLIELAKSKTK